MNEEIRERYLERLEWEKDEYIQQLYNHTLPEEILSKAEEVLAFKNAYEYLRGQTISDDELRYVMQAMNPIHEVAGFRQAFDLEKEPENNTELAVFDICSKDLFAEPDIPKYIGRVPIQFHRKVSSLDEIKRMPRNREDEDFVIKKIVELSPEDFDKFAKNLFEPMPFLPFTDKDSFEMIKDGAWRCLLVHDKERGQGMLVDSSGYDYARYCAYVENTKELDLEGIPSQKYSLDQTKRSRKSKQPER